MFYSLDYGNGAKLVAWGPHGEVKFPRLAPRPRSEGPRSQAEKFRDKLAWLIEQGDVVFEQSTPGTSGADRDMIEKVAANAGHKIYLLSVRAVRARARDEKLPGFEISDQDAARLIYELATEAFARPNHDGLSEYRAHRADYQREHTSVRPYDKHDYRHPQVEEWMRILPPFGELPAELQTIFGLPSGVYSRAMVLPFAMAMHEPDYRAKPTRATFEKMIGLHSHGAPSFYRRKTVEVMQMIAKLRGGYDHFADVSASERKVAWREARRVIRKLHAVMRARLDQDHGHVSPLMKGTPDPA